VLQEQTEKGWLIEDDECGDEQEKANAHEVLHRVIRMKGNAIQWLPIGSLVLLDFDAVRVIGSRGMQRTQMQHHQQQQHQRQRDHMQREKAVERGSSWQEIAHDPLDQLVPNHGNRAEQRDDDLCTPE